MSEAKDLLNGLSEAEYTSYSAIAPVNDVLLINAETRTIDVPSTEILFGVETDKDVERKYFRCPRIVGDNIDLSTLQLRVHYQNANGERDKYIAEDVTVDGDYITFSWLLSGKVLKYKGSIQFTIVAVSINQDGTLNKEWNTTLASGTVLEGLEVEDLDEGEEQQARDILLQLLNMLDNKADESIQKVQTRAEEIIASMPADYTEMDKAVKQNTNDIEYLKQHGGGGGSSTATKDEVTLLVANWITSDDESHYTQAVELDDITNNTKVDLDPTPDQLVSLINDGISMCAINENGSITIYAIGDKPTSDMTISVIKSEVVYV